MRPEQDRGAIAFAERLLTMLDEGSFTATYKYAVLLALMDVCLEHIGRSGEAPSMITTEQLAGRVIELYWPQTIPFGAQAILRQNSGGQAEIVQLIRRFRERRGADPSDTIGHARLNASSAYARLVKAVEWKLVEMPLPRLQQVGAQSVPFVYRIAWDRRVSRAEFDHPAFDNRIFLVDGAGDHLVRLAGLLRPLVQRQWASMVARLNGDLTGDAELDAFLFGQPRISLATVSGPLRELQANRCFYCRRTINGPADVDHFLPWARYPDNGIENLVVADPRCNRNKREHLAAGEHVERWVERFKGPGSQALLDVAGALRWERHPERTRSASRAIYLRLPDSAKLWLLGRDFVDADHRLLETALG